MNERFHYRRESQSIKDNLTGYIYSDLGTVTDLLNELNKRADRNAENYHIISRRMINNVVEDTTYKKMYKELHQVALENLEENLKYHKIMRKYGIKSLERLDHILFYARKW